MQMNDRRNGLTFDEWMKGVDAILLDACGMSHMDLADRDYWNGWDSGTTPNDFVVDEWGDPEDIESFMSNEMMF